jgi:Fur family transcriptional regulator, ferric uptake regulator
MKEALKLFTKYLDKQGIALSEAHKSICLAAFDMHDHFTLGDLCSRFPDHSETQVEEVLSQLVLSGLVRKLIFREDRIFYEHVYGHIHHDHLICVGCGKIDEFTHPDIEIKQADVAREYGFEMLRHALRIEGLCADCQKKPKVTNLAPAPKLPRRAEIPLSMAANGEHVQVSKIRGGKHMQQRLASMGVIPGDNIEIVQNTFTGPITIRARDTRIAIGHCMSHKIFVKSVS